MIRLIASDIDGTLVRDGSHVIDPAYYEAIRALRQKGIFFCACSGRQYKSMMELFGPVAGDIFFITENGTLLRTGDRILKKWTFQPGQYLSLLKDIRAIDGVTVVVSAPDVSYVDAGEDSTAFRLLADNYLYSIQNIPDLASVPEDQILKIVLYHDDIESGCREFMQSHWARDLQIAASGPIWMDICPSEAGKGSALACLRNHLGISKEETLYFGDNMNDLTAFREAGTAATVANARREVKEAADFIAGSYEDLGVLKELHRILDHDFLQIS